MEYLKHIFFFHMPLLQLYQVAGAAPEAGKHRQTHQPQQDIQAHGQHPPLAPQEEKGAVDPEGLHGEGHGEGDGEPAAYAEDHSHHGDIGGVSCGHFLLLFGIICHYSTVGAGIKKDLRWQEGRSMLDKFLSYDMLFKHFFSVKCVKQENIVC